MERGMVERHLQQARAHVALGGLHIARQREIVAEMMDRGIDTTEAIRLLVNFEASQVMHVAHLDRLNAELLALQ